MRENPLDEVVAILIASNVNERDAGPIDTAFGNSIQVATEKFVSSNLQALLNHLGSELIRAVLSSIANDVINCSAAISRGSMLTDVLDAPVAELAVGNNVDVCQNLFDAGTLFVLVNCLPSGQCLIVSDSPCLPPDSSRKCFVRLGYRSRPRQPRATCLEEPR